MRLTIIRIDGAVYKDGLSYVGLSLSTVPEDVHALQWYDTHGEIEFVGAIQPNQPIQELPVWALDAVALWDAANVEANTVQPDPIAEGA